MQLVQSNLDKFNSFHQANERIKQGITNYEPSMQHDSGFVFEVRKRDIDLDIDSLEFARVVLNEIDACKDQIKDYIYTAMVRTGVNELCPLTVIDRASGLEFSVSYSRERKYLSIETKYKLIGNKGVNSCS